MIVVTGASGKTGRELVRPLASRGVSLRAVVRDSAQAANLAATNVEIAIADLADPETLTLALAGVDKAYLMTAAAPELVRLHSNFIRAARLAGVRHIVRHSVRGADAGSPVKLGRWHAASQTELEASGLAGTHLQPVYNMQNFLKFAPTMQARSAFYAPMKDSALSMVDARDIAAVAAAALTGMGHEGKTYVIQHHRFIGRLRLCKQPHIRHTQSSTRVRETAQPAPAKVGWCANRPQNCEWFRGSSEAARVDSGNPLHNAPAHAPASVRGATGTGGHNYQKTKNLDTLACQPKLS
jgi:uncharacterized protein YbjT (DUF2867 family)